MKCPVCGEFVNKQSNYLDAEFYVSNEFPKEAEKYLKKHFIIANTFDSVIIKYVDKVVKYTCKNKHVFFMEE